MRILIAWRIAMSTIVCDLAILFSGSYGSPTASTSLKFVVVDEKYNPSGI